MSTKTHRNEYSREIWYSSVLKSSITYCWTNNQNLQVTHKELCITWMCITFYSISIWNNDRASIVWQSIYSVLRNWLINSRTQVSQSLQKRERKIEVFWELHYESLLLQKILQSSRHKIKTDHNNFLNAHSWSYCAQFIILKKKIRIWNNFLFGWCQIMIKLSTLHSQKYIWQQIKQIKWVISTF